MCIRDRCVAVEAALSAPDAPQEVPATCRMFSLPNISIQPATEERYLLVHLSVGTILTAQTSVEGPGQCAGADTLLDLYAAPLVASPGRPYCTANNPGTLACDDDGGDGACSMLTYVSSSVQDVVLRLTSVGGATQIPDVSLLLSVRTPGCGDGVPDPGEECDDGNSRSGDGCALGCLLEGDLCSAPVVLEIPLNGGVHVGPLTTTGATQNSTAACGMGSSLTGDVVFELQPLAAGVLVADVRPLSAWNPVLSVVCLLYTSPSPRD